MERVDTVVIGGGQAGLAASYFLTEEQRDHIVLERGRVAETWRSQRWDGFCLNTPNWSLQLPGAEYDGPEPDAFAPLAAVIDHLEAYARSFAAPLRENTAARHLRRRDGRFVVEAENSTVESDNVVVASGAFQQPRARLPGVGSASVALQLTSSEYRRPADLPEGAVLVVGGGQSACQISDELLSAGRPVWLSSGSCGWFPRAYRGRDYLHWAGDIGFLDQTVDSLPSPAARVACNPPISGNDGGHDCHPRWLAGRGARIVGRLIAIDGSRARFGEGVEQTLGTGDAFAEEFMTRVDEFIAARGLDAPAAEERARGPSPIADTPTLDLRKHGISTILWATGFRPDYTWIDLDVTDEYGWPVHERGVSPHPGLFFVGVNWLHKRRSALFCGVGEDAEHVVSELVARR